MFALMKRALPHPSLTSHTPKKPLSLSLHPSSRYSFSTLQFHLLLSRTVNQLNPWTNIDISHISCFNSSNFLFRYQSRNNVFLLVTRRHSPPETWLGLQRSEAVSPAKRPPLFFSTFHPVTNTINVELKNNTILHHQTRFGFRRRGRQRLIRPAAGLAGLSIVLTTHASGSAPPTPPTTTSSSN